MRNCKINESLTKGNSIYYIFKDFELLKLKRIKTLKPLLYKKGALEVKINGHKRDYCKIKTQK